MQIDREKRSGLRNRRSKNAGGKVLMTLGLTDLFMKMSIRLMWHLSHLSSHHLLNKLQAQLSSGEWRWFLVFPSIYEYGLGQKVYQHKPLYYACVGDTRIVAWDGNLRTLNSTRISRVKASFDSSLVSPLLICTCICHCYNSRTGIKLQNTPANTSSQDLPPPAMRASILIGVSIFFFNTHYPVFSHFFILCF